MVTIYGIVFKDGDSYEVVADSASQVKEWAKWNSSPLVHLERTGSCKPCDIEELGLEDIRR